jgi:hypothetical protein
VLNGWYVLQDVNNVYPEIKKVRFLAGDVDGDFYVEPFDASMIQSYFVTGGTFPVFDKPWEFWNAEDVVSTQQGSANNVLQVEIPVGSGAITKDYLGLVSGDFNRSFGPPDLKSAGGTSESLTILQGESVRVLPIATIDLPVKAGSAMQVGAISLILNYPSEKLQVESVFLKDQPDQPLTFNTVNGELRIGWNSMKPISLATGETMLTVRVKMTSGVAEGEVCRFEMALNPLNELADGGFDVIQNASLIIDGLELKTNVTSANPIPDRSAEMLMNCYPNPFRENASIKYTLPEDGIVNLELTSIIGSRIILLSDQQQTAGEYLVNLEGNKLVPGVYMVTLRLMNQHGFLPKTVRLVKQ